MNFNKFIKPALCQKIKQLSKGFVDTAEDLDEIEALLVELEAKVTLLEEDKNNASVLIFREDQPYNFNFVLTSAGSAIETFYPKIEYSIEDPVKTDEVIATVEYIVKDPFENEDVVFTFNITNPQGESGGKTLIIGDNNNFIATYTFQEGISVISTRVTNKGQTNRVTVKKVLAYRT